MEKIFEQFEELKKQYPEIADAMHIFEMGMAEYKQAYQFLNEPQTTTSNTSGEVSLPID
jgi:exonuclease VII small subunit